MNTQTPNPRKKRAGILSLILIALLLLSGTYAWQYNQHKTTEATADNDAILKSVQLVDESASTDSWTTGAALDKKLYVKNDGTDGTGGTEAFESVYVRIELKEYMERTNVGQEVYPNRLMIDTSGDFVSYDTQAEADAAYPNHTSVKLTNALDATAPTTEKWFVETAKGDPNGQYGNFMTTKVTNEQAYIDDTGAWTPGSAKATVPANDYHMNGDTEECDYPAIEWDGQENDKAGNARADEFRKYVEIAFENDVLFLSDGTPTSQGDYWLIDDVTDKTYAYWMQPLAPQAATKLFTESMELIESPNGQYDDGSGQMVDYPLNFYYALHADLDPTLKADHTTDWSGMNADIENVLFPAKKPFKIKSFGAYYGEITDGQTITVGKDFLSQVFFFQTEPTKPGASVPEIEWTTGAVPADWSTIFDPNYAQQMGLIADSAKSQMTLPYPSTGISAMDPSKVSGIVAFESYSDHRAATITFANGSLSVTATPKDGSAPVSFNINVNVNPIKVTSFVFDPSPGSYNDGDETDVIQGQVSTVELDPDAAHTFRIKASDVLPFKQLIFTIGNTYNSADVADLPDIGVTTIKEGQEYEISIPAKWYENHDIDNKIGNDSKIILGALPSYFIDLYVNHPTP